MRCKRRWLPAWQRVELVSLCLDQGLSRREAASWRRVSVSTVQFWIERYRQATEAERRRGQWAQDRPSTPHRQPGRMSEAVHDRVCAARKRTGWGPRLIAGELGMARATVSRCLARRGLPRLPRGRRRASRCGALSGRAPVIWCKWTPSAWPGSPGPGTRPPATARLPAPKSASAWAGSSVTR